MHQAHRERNSWIYSWESRWFSIFSWSCWWSQKHCKNSGMLDPLLENQVKTVVTWVDAWISIALPFSLFDPCSELDNWHTQMLCTSPFPFFWHTPWYRYLLMLFKFPELPHSSSRYTNVHLSECFICFLFCLPEELLKIIWVIFFKVNAYRCHHHQFLVPFSSIFVWWYAVSSIYVIMSPLL